MKKEEKEKIRLKIEGLKNKKDLLIFELSTLNSFWIGMVAFLIAIFIPIIVYFAQKHKLNGMVLSGLFLIALLIISHKILKIFFSEKKENKLNEIFYKINSKYEELLK